MIHYELMSYADLVKQRAIEQYKLDKNPLNSIANANWQRLDYLVRTYWTRRPEHLYKTKGTIA